jgi:hypothetical protein
VPARFDVARSGLHARQDERPLEAGWLAIERIERYATRGQEAFEETMN